MNAVVAPLVVLLAFIPLVAASPHAAQTESWSWQSSDVTGALAVRLTLDFPEPTECAITFATYGEVLGNQEELFMGRDDVADLFLAASMDDDGSRSAGWSLPGETDIDRIGHGGEQGGFRVTNVAVHEGTEPWIFIGLGLGINGDAPSGVAAFELGITCDGAFSVAEEAGREVAPFGPGLVCSDREALGVGVYGCLAFLSVADARSWEITSQRGVLRYSLFSGIDFGRVTLEGPGIEDEMVIHSPVGGLVSGVRIESGPGVYTQTLTHTGVLSFFASGWAIGLEPVASLDDWIDLPTFP